MPTADVDRVPELELGFGDFGGDRVTGRAGLTSYSAREGSTH